MPLHEKSKTRIDTLLRKAGCGDADVVLATNIVETLSDRLHKTAQMANKAFNVRHDIDTDTLDDRFHIVFKDGIDMFTAEHARLVTSQSPTRVINVLIDATTRRVTVVVARADVPTTRRVHPVVYEPTGRSAKRLYVETDYTTSGVRSTDDQRTIDSLKHDVYHMEARVSADMLFWFEVIRDDSGVSTRSGAHIPLSELLSEASESDASEAGASGPAIGYSLCFTRPPVVTSAFFAHLATKYPSLIASMYVWLCSETDGFEPMFVINVRSTETLSGMARNVVSSRMPRTRVRRITAKRSAADALVW